MANLGSQQHPSSTIAAQPPSIAAAQQGSQMKQQQYPLYPLPFSAPLDASRNYDIVRATFFQGQQFFGCVRGDSALLKHINLDLYEQDALILEGIQLAQRTYATVSCMEFLPAQLFDDLCLAVGYSHGGVSFFYSRFRCECVLSFCAQNLEFPISEIQCTGDIISQISEKKLSEEKDPDNHHPGRIWLFYKDSHHGGFTGGSAQQGGSSSENNNNELYKPTRGSALLTIKIASLKQAIEDVFPAPSGSEFAPEVFYLPALSNLQNDNIPGFGSASSNSMNDNTSMNDNSSTINKNLTTINRVRCFSRESPVMALTTNNMMSSTTSSGGGGVLTKPQNSSSSTNRRTQVLVCGKRPFLALYEDLFGSDANHAVNPATVTQALGNAVGYLMGKYTPSLASAVASGTSEGGAQGSRNFNPLHVRSGSRLAAGFCQRESILVHSTMYANESTLYASRKFEDASRTALDAVLSPGGDYVAVSDTLGRVGLYCADSLRVLHLWKGYRLAQCLFLNCDTLCVYASRRGLLEVWDIPKKQRKSAFNLGTHTVCTLLTQSPQHFTTDFDEFQENRALLIKPKLKTGKAALLGLDAKPRIFTEAGEEDYDSAKSDSSEGGGKDSSSLKNPIQRLTHDPYDEQMCLPDHLLDGRKEYRTSPARILQWYGRLSEKRHKQFFVAALLTAHGKANRRLILRFNRSVRTNPPPCGLGGGGLLVGSTGPASSSTAAGLGTVRNDSSEWVPTSSQQVPSVFESPTTRRGPVPGAAVRKQLKNIISAESVLQPSVTTLAVLYSLTQKLGDGAFDGNFQTMIREEIAKLELYLEILAPHVECASASETAILQALATGCSGKESWYDAVGGPLLLQQKMLQQKKSHNYKNCNTTKNNFKKGGEQVEEPLLSRQEGEETQSRDRVAAFFDYLKCSCAQLDTRSLGGLARRAAKQAFEESVVDFRYDDIFDEALSDEEDLVDSSSSDIDIEEEEEDVDDFVAKNNAVRGEEPDDVERENSEQKAVGSSLKREEGSSKTSSNAGFESPDSEERTFLDAEEHTNINEDVVHTQQPEKDLSQSSLARGPLQRNNAKKPPGASLRNGSPGSPPTEERRSCVAISYRQFSELDTRQRKFVDFVLGPVLFPAALGPDVNYAKTVQRVLTACCGGNNGTTHNYSSSIKNNREEEGSGAGRVFLKWFFTQELRILLESVPTPTDGPFGSNTNLRSSSGNNLLASLEEIRNRANNNNGEEATEEDSAGGLFSYFTGMTGSGAASEEADNLQKNTTKKSAKKGLFDDDSDDDGSDDSMKGLFQKDKEVWLPEKGPQSGNFANKAPVTSDPAGSGPSPASAQSTPRSEQMGFHGDEVALAPGCAEEDEFSNIQQTGPEVRAGGATVRRNFDTYGDDDGDSDDDDSGFSDSQFSDDYSPSEEEAANNNRAFPEGGNLCDLPTSVEVFGKSFPIVGTGQQSLFCRTLHACLPALQKESALLNSLENVGSSDLPHAWFLLLVLRTLGDYGERATTTQNKAISSSNSVFVALSSRETIQARFEEIDFVLKLAVSLACTDSKFSNVNIISSCCCGPLTLKRFQKALPSVLACRYAHNSQVQQQQNQVVDVNQLQSFWRQNFSRMGNREKPQQLEAMTAYMNLGIALEPLNLLSVAYWYESLANRSATDKNNTLERNRFDSGRDLMRNGNTLKLPNL